MFIQYVSRFYSAWSSDSAFSIKFLTLQFTIHYAFVTSGRNNSCEKSDSAFTNLTVRCKHDLPYKLTSYFLSFKRNSIGSQQMIDTIAQRIVKQVLCSIT